MIPVSWFPALKHREVLGLLRRAGYRVQRQSGSHRRLVAPDRPPLTLAMHAGRAMSPRHLRSLLAQAQLTDEEIVDLLWAGRPPGGLPDG